jgi:hypothetical protein
LFHVQRAPRGGRGADVVLSNIVDGVIVVTGKVLSDPVEKGTIEIENVEEELPDGATMGNEPVDVLDERLNKEMLGTEGEVNDTEMVVDGVGVEIAKGDVESGGGESVMDQCWLVCIVGRVDIEQEMLLVTSFLSPTVEVDAAISVGVTVMVAFPVETINVVVVVTVCVCGCVCVCVMIRVGPCPPLLKAYCGGMKLDTCGKRADRGIVIKLEVVAD